MAPHILIILGSTRQGRKGEAVAHWFMHLAGGREDATFELVDLRDWPLPFLDAPVPPASGQYDPAARPWAEKIATAARLWAVSWMLPCSSKAAQTRGMPTCARIGATASSINTRRSCSAPR